MVRPYVFSKKSMSNKIKLGAQMKHRESDILIVSMRLRIINSDEKRGIHNTALDKETLSIHRDGGNNENEISKNK